MNRIFKTIFAVVIFLSLALFPVEVESGGFEMLKGTAETLGKAIIGETTITPYYGINTWDYIDKYIDSPGTTVKSRWKVRYDKFLNAYHFEQESHYHSDPPFISTANFSIPNLAHWVYNSDGSDGTYPDSVVQTYTLIITCTQVSTGAFPPTPPFKISFKTDATELPAALYDTHYGLKGQFRKSFMVSPIGSVQGTIGFPNFFVDFPMDVWAGDTYDHH